MFSSPCCVRGVAVVVVGVVVAVVQMGMLLSAIDVWRGWSIGVVGEGEEARQDVRQVREEEASSTTHCPRW